MDYKVEQVFSPIKVEFTIKTKDELEMWIGILGLLTGEKSIMTYYLFDRLYGILKSIQ